MKIWRIGNPRLITWRRMSWIKTTPSNFQPTTQPTKKPTTARGLMTRISLMTRRCLMKKRRWMKKRRGKIKGSIKKGRILKVLMNLHYDFLTPFFDWGMIRSKSNNHQSMR